MLLALDEHLKKYLRDDNNMRNFSAHICQNFPKIYEKKPHVLMGIGFVSSKDGLSQGVPIDIVSMFLNALKLAETLGENSKIVILIADHQAFSCEHSSCKDHPQHIIAMRDKYIKKLTNIATNLGVLEKIVFVKSSDIIPDPRYTALLKEIKQREEAIQKEDVLPISQDTREIISITKPYEATHVEYFNEQIALTQYLFNHMKCGIKMGWTRHSDNNEIKKAKRFCEAHFDRFYRDLYQQDDKKMSLVYSIPGFNLVKKGINGREIPYSAPRKENVVRVLCSIKSGLPKNITEANPEFIQAMHYNVGTIEKRVKLPPEKREIVEDLTLIREITRSPMKNLIAQYDTLRMGNESPNGENDEKRKGYRIN